MDEELDKNKTSLTHRVTAAAWAYLEGAGFKPVETEVPVAPGWVADLASYAYPTRTEAKKLRLIALARRVVGEQSYSELQYRYGPLLTALVEVKVDRGDFAKDIERKVMCRRPPAHLCYLAYPAGVVDIKELPYGWIGLKTTKDGTRISKVERGHLYRIVDGRGSIATLHPQHPGDLADFIAAVGIRRDHRTRYAVIRNWRKMHAASERERTRAYSTRRLIEVLCRFLRGDGNDRDFDYGGETGVRGVLKYAGVKNIPAALDGDIAWLEATRHD